MNTVLELVEVVKWNAPKLLVQVEVEGVARTVMHFDKGEEQLAERMRLDLLEWPIDQLDALKEKYSEMRADFPKGRKADKLAGLPASVKPSQMTRGQLKGLLDEAEKFSKEVVRLKKQISNEQALLKKAEDAKRKAWDDVAVAIEQLKIS